MLSVFFNISGSNSAHKRIDYFQKKDDLQYVSTDWKWIRGYTIKAGANVNLDEYNNVFFNTGYISKAPKFSNIYTQSNTLQTYINNEEVKAIEGGYSFRSSSFSANINTYFTVWENKPANISATFGSDNYSDEGLLSLGDWKWTSGGEAIILDSDNNAPSFELGYTNSDTLQYNANGVHVGDAAQTQYGLSIRYEPTYKSYIKLRGTYFADYYSDFDAATLSGENSGRESWVIPAYQLIDLHCGYKFKLSDNHKLDIKLSVLNLLDEMYISDAQNNDAFNSPSYSDFDAKSASVFFGLGRRMNLSAKFSF